MQRVSLTERKLRWSVKESKFAIDSETNGEMERETNVRRGRSGVEREDEASSGTSEHDLSAPACSRHASRSRRPVPSLSLSIATSRALSARPHQRLCAK